MAGGVGGSPNAAAPPPPTPPAAAHQLFALAQLPTLQPQGGDVSALAVQLAGTALATARLAADPTCSTVPPFASLPGKSAPLHLVHCNFVLHRVASAIQFSELHSAYTATLSLY